MVFRPANEKPVELRILIALAGPTGSGKTYSAMEIASGIAGDKPFAVIDTESNRALHYRDDFKFDHDTIDPPFRPSKYAEKIQEAIDAGYDVVVVDSGSHGHAGEGGLLDMHEEELQRMAGDDASKRDKCKMAAWIKPKAEHKRMVQQLLRADAKAIIFCMRAEEKTGVVKGDRGEMKVANLGWKMTCEKNLPYEFTASLMMSDANPGTYNVIKSSKHLGDIFDGTRITKQTGEGLLEWSNGPATLEKANNDPAEASMNLIMLANTEAELEAVGVRIAKLGLTGENRKRVGAVYQAARTALKGVK